jgi:hypothetical protein
MLFLPKPPADRSGLPVVRGPQFTKHWLRWKLRKYIEAGILTFTHTSVAMMVIRVGSMAEWSTTHVARTAKKKKKNRPILKYMDKYASSFPFIHSWMAALYQLFRLCDQTTGRGEKESTCGPLEGPALTMRKRLKATAEHELTMTMMYYIRCGFYFSQISNSYIWRCNYL